MKSLTDRQTGKYYKGSEETHRTEQKPNDNWKRCLAVKTGVTRFSEGARLHNMKTPLTQMLIKHVKQDWFFCSVFVSHSLHSFLEIRLSVSRKCFQLKSSSIFHQLHPGTSTWNADAVSWLVISPRSRQMLLCVENWFWWPDESSVAQN